MSENNRGCLTLLLIPLMTAAFIWAYDYVFLSQPEPESSSYQPLDHYKYVHITHQPSTGVSMNPAVGFVTEYLIMQGYLILTDNESSPVGPTLRVNVCLTSAAPKQNGDDCNLTVQFISNSDNGLVAVASSVGRGTTPLLATRDAVYQALDSLFGKPEVISHSRKCLFGHRLAYQ